MRNYYLQTLEGAPRLGQTREELETYFDVCLEAHSEDPTNWGERIYSALVDVAEKYGVDNVPLVFWHIRDTMGRTGYYAVDLWNERNPEQVEPEPVEEPKEEGSDMAQNIEVGTQLVTSGSEYTIVDETDKTISYVDEAGELHVIEKSPSILPWILGAAAAFFFLG